MATDNTILIKIKADSDKALKEIKDLNTKIKTLSKSSNNSSKGISALNKSFSTLGKTLAATAVSFAAYQGLSKVVSTLADFETAMKKLGAVSGATDDELKKLEDTAKAMGETTRYSATQAAEGLNFLAMAGFSVQDSITSLPSVLDLATVGSLDLATASDISSDSLTAFGLEAEDMERLVDVMAKTITSSNTTVEKLGDSFKKVAPVATSLGLSIEETSASLGVLADAGIKAELAGTQLKIALLRLSSDKTAQKAMNELGVSAYDAEGNFKGLAKITAELKPALAKLSKQAKVVALKQIFGSEAIASGTVLINKTETLTARIKDLNSANGEAKKIAKEMNDTLQAGFDEVYSAMEAVVLSASDELIPFLKDITKETSAWIRSIDKDKVVAFAHGVKSLAEEFGIIISLLAKLNDIAMPDFLGGKDSTFLGTVADGWSKIFERMELVFLSSEKATESSKKYNTALKDTIEKNAKLAKQDEISKKNIDKRRQSTADLIRKVSKEIAVLESQKNYLKKGTYATKEHDLAIKSLKGTLSKLKTEYGNLDKVEVKSIENKKDANKSSKNLTDTLNKEADANKELTDSQKKQASSWAVAYKKRESSALDTINKIEHAEINLENEIKKLIKEESEIRRKFSNDRVNIENDIADKLRNASQKGMSELQKYNSDKLAISKKSSDIEQALLEKNYDLAKNLISDYDSLIEKSAGNEISHLKEVSVYNSDTKKYEIKQIKEIDVTRNDSLNSYKNNLNFLKDKLIEVNLADENSAIKAHNAKIDAKLLELSLMKEELSIQIEIAKAMTDAVSSVKGIKNGADFSKAEAGLKRIDEISKTLEKRKKVLKYKTEVDSNSLNKLKNSLSNDEALKEKTVNIKVDSSSAISSINEVDSKITGIRTKLSEENYIKITAKKEELENLKIELSNFLNENKEAIISINDSQAKTKFQEMKQRALALTAEIESIKNLGISTEFADAKIAETSNKINIVKTDAETGAVLTVTTDTAGIEEVKTDITTIDNANPIVEVAADGSEIARVADNIASLSLINPIIAISTDETEILKTSNNIKSLSNIKPIIRIGVDATAVIRAINNLKRPTSSTHTVFVRTVQRRSTGGIIDDIPKFKDGGDVNFTRKKGSLGGYGGGDKVKALLEAGEFVIRKEAVKSLGVDRLKVINQGEIPKFKVGGFVSPIQKFSTGGEVKSSQSNTVELNLNIGNNSFKTFTDEDVATSLERYMRKYQ